MITGGTSHDHGNLHITIDDPLSIDMFHQFTFINHGFYGVLWVSVGLEPPFPMIFHHIVGFVNHPLESVNYGFYGNLGLFFSYC